MRVLGALVLAVAGSIFSFFSVLNLLDGPTNPLEAEGGTGRLAAFAMPGLSASFPENLADLRPIPVTTAPQSTVLTPSTASPSPFGPEEKEKPKVASRAAIVPPIARRLPKSPPAGEATIVTAGTEPSQIPPAGSIAKARRPMQPLDATTRSALGGPMPSTALKPAANPPPAKPRASRTNPSPTTEPREPTTP